MSTVWPFLDTLLPPVWCGPLGGCTPYSLSLYSVGHSLGTIKVKLLTSIRLVSSRLDVHVSLAIDRFMNALIM